MHLTLRHTFAVAIAIMGVVYSADSTLAQDKYPYRPIRIIQGFSAGGVSDTLARIVGDKLSERFGQSVVVAAKPGGGGIVGMITVIEATPDGYTLLLGNSTFGDFIDADAKKWANLVREARLVF